MLSKSQRGPSNSQRAFLKEAFGSECNRKSTNYGIYIWRSHWGTRCYKCVYWISFDLLQLLYILLNEGLGELRNMTSKPIDLSSSYHSWYLWKGRVRALRLPTMLGNRRQPCGCCGGQIHARLPHGAVPLVKATNGFWLVQNDPTSRRRREIWYVLRLCKIG